MARYWKVFLLVITRDGSSMHQTYKVKKEAQSVEDMDEKGKKIK
jgi:hypothetical protein